MGGPASSVIEVATLEETVDAVRSIDAAGQPLLLLAGGSNVVMSDAGFPGVVVLLRSRGVECEALADPNAVLVRVAAGHPFDELVAYCVDAGFAGLECLSGVPGSAGATPIQNVGAYGQEVAEVIRSVTAYDRTIGEVVELSPEQCAFTYRNSIFKHNDRYVVLRVDFVLRRDMYGGPLRYGELSRRLGVGSERGKSDGKAQLADIRGAVLELRRGKGMVIDPEDPDSRSVGSFFTNPVLSSDAWTSLQQRVAAEHPALDIPHWTQEDGSVKIPAAWLVEHAGFAKGYRRGGVAISSKHTLALINCGDGSPAELLELAREIRNGVRAQYEVELINEPVLVGEKL